MPVHQFVHDHHLVERGLRNYWGYNSIAFLAPHNDYTFSHRQPGGSRARCRSSRRWSRRCTTPGIEVILDVVYNHTAEGNHLGPMLSMRGIDNLAYYRLVDDEPALLPRLHRHREQPQHAQPARAAADHGQPAVLGHRDARRRLPLRPRVDARPRAVRRRPALGVLRPRPAGPGRLAVKLIAEPWDVGEGGYQVGNFPPLWSEWNGRYRDTIRDFWRGEPADARRVRLPVHRSSDLYQADTRRPTASINFVTAHDGFTLADLVSYNEKHNEANGEDNRDGESHNRSWNCGAEGPDRRPGRSWSCARGNVATSSTTLLLSQGVPMILGGDELGRTQGGNNNAYCQDNEISWFDWDDATPIPRVVPEGHRLRAAQPVFRRRRWFQGRAIRGTESSSGCVPTAQG